MKRNENQTAQHPRRAVGTTNVRARPIRIRQGDDVLIVRSALQRRLLEVLPTAEWRPHISGLAKQLKKAPSSVWDAYKALQRQGLHAEITLTLVPGLVEAGRPVQADNVTATLPSVPRCSGRTVG
jgi:hypothetical protein